MGVVLVCDLGGVLVSEVLGVWLRLLVFGDGGGTLIWDKGGVASAHGWEGIGTNKMGMGQLIKLKNRSNVKSLISKVRMLVGVDGFNQILLRTL